MVVPAQGVVQLSRWRSLQGIEHGYVSLGGNIAGRSRKTGLSTISNTDYTDTHILKSVLHLRLIQ